MDFQAKTRQIWRNFVVGEREFYSCGKPKPRTIVIPMPDPDNQDRETIYDVPEYYINETHIYIFISTSLN